MIFSIKMGHASRGAWLVKDLSNPLGFKRKEKKPAFRWFV